MKCAFGILDRGSKNSGWMTILYERDSSNRDPKISKNAILIFTRSWWMDTQLLIGSIILWRKDDLRVPAELDLSCTYLSNSHDCKEGDGHVNTGSYPRAKILNRLTLYSH